MPFMKPTNETGIVGYGSYVPRYRLPATEVAQVWTDGKGGIEQVAVDRARDHAEQPVDGHPGLRHGPSYLDHERRDTQRDDP